MSREIEILNNRPSYQDIERIDEIIIRILNNTRKKVEANRRNISFSKEKQRRRSAILY